MPIDSGTPVIFECQRCAHPDWVGRYGGTDTDRAGLKIEVDHLPEMTDLAGCVITADATPQTGCTRFRTHSKTEQSRSG